MACAPTPGSSVAARSVKATRLRRPKPPPAAKAFKPTIGLSDNDPRVTTGVAPAGAGLDSAPAGTPFDIDADPAVLRIRASNLQSIGDAEASAEARRKQLAIQFGDADLARALGLGDATANAAGGNPFSTLGNLRNTSQERTTDLEHRHLDLLALSGRRQASDRLKLAPSGVAGETGHGIEERVGTEEALRARSLVVELVRLVREADDPEHVVRTALRVGARALLGAHHSLDTAIVERRFAEFEIRIEQDFEKAVGLVAETAEHYLDPDHGTLKGMLDELEKVLGESFDPKLKASVPSRLAGLLSGGAAEIKTGVRDIGRSGQPGEPARAAPQRDEQRVEGAASDR